MSKAPVVVTARSFSILLAASVMVFVPFASASELGFPSAAFGMKYRTLVSDDALAKTPVWKDADENPPLHARRAITLAEDMVTQLVAPNNEWNRRLEAITLAQKGDRWYWRAQFIWLPKGGGLGGVPHYIDIIVLMDGTVLKPRVLEKDMPE